LVLVSGIFVAPGDQLGVFTFAQGEIIPIVPGTDCITSALPNCTWNYVLSFSTPDGSFSGLELGGDSGSEAAVAIYDTAGDPLAFMQVNGGPSAIYEMWFISGANGGPLDLARSRYQFGARLPLPPGLSLREEYKTRWTRILQTGTSIPLNLYWSRRNRPRCFCSAP
jgi:hypothetical protein